MKLKIFYEFERKDTDNSLEVLSLAHTILLQWPF